MNIGRIASYCISALLLIGLLVWLGRPIPSKPIELPKNLNCFAFNLDSLEISNERYRWSVTDGEVDVIDEASSEREAERALSVIRHYQMTRKCFFTDRESDNEERHHFFLTADGAPEGIPLPGEDCLSLAGGRLEIKQSRDKEGWNVVHYRSTDPSKKSGHLPFYFYKLKSARKAMEITKGFGFQKHCYVGRPDAAMQYLKR